MVLEIAPNTQLFVQILLLFFALGGIANIISGVRKTPKKTHNGPIETISGIILLFIVAIVFLL